MTCATLPAQAPEIYVDVQVVQVDVNFTTTFVADPSSPNSAQYVDSNGNVNLSGLCKNTQIHFRIVADDNSVKFHRDAPGSGKRYGISYAFMHGGVRIPVQAGDPQFPSVAITGNDHELVVTYGNYHRINTYPSMQSDYALYLKNSNGYMGEVDPVITNGSAAGLSLP